jgi:hypothetical protein
MTRDQEINRLLQQVPKQSRKRVVAFLRGLAHKDSTKPTKRGWRDKQFSVADRSFGMIAADAATVREVLSEDLYDLE